MKLAASALTLAIVTIGASARAQSGESFDSPIDSALSQIALQVESHATVAADTVSPARDPSLAGIGFVGALAWYPGALAGLLSGAAKGDGKEGEHRWVAAIVVGGGASTGLVIGLLTASKRRCDPIRAIGRAVLGAEIGSIAGAAATGLYAFSLHGGGGVGVIAAPVVIPLASALVAVAFVRGCDSSD